MYVSDYCRTIMLYGSQVIKNEVIVQYRYYQTTTCSVRGYHRLLLVSISQQSIFKIMYEAASCELSIIAKGQD